MYLNTEAVGLFVQQWLIVGYRNAFIELSYIRLSTYCRLLSYHTLTSLHWTGVWFIPLYVIFKDVSFSFFFFFEKPSSLKFIFRHPADYTLCSVE